MAQRPTRPARLELNIGGVVVALDVSEVDLMPGKEERDPLALREPDVITATVAPDLLSELRLSQIREVEEATRKAGDRSVVNAEDFAAAIMERDQIIHDLMHDRGIQNQNALPPNQARAETDRLRGILQRIRELPKQAMVHLRYEPLQAEWASDFIDALNGLLREALNDS